MSSRRAEIKSSQEPQSSRTLTGTSYCAVRCVTFSCSSFYCVCLIARINNEISTISIVYSVNVESKARSAGGRGKGTVLPVTACSLFSAAGKKQLFVGWKRK